MPNISKDKLKLLAVELENQIEENITDSAVQALKIALSDTLDKAKNGKFKSTISTLNGSSAFLHGTLSELRLLNEAFSKFKLYITLGV
ncbi:hypothetical protein [Photobacterium sp. GB-56]|uniref:hypothetical protein n=1 Tax=Photobacterium sp. GB-56 TaxID=2022106 RepID=UPI000D18281B|nr:hypothetical protein [Photobacterium sp. GB-56]PSV21037.1 hypothetical protein C9J42_21065 [Photobacterium sp. GB-56]